LPIYPEEKKWTTQDIELTTKNIIKLSTSKQNAQSTENPLKKIHGIHCEKKNICCNNILPQKNKVQTKLMNMPTLDKVLLPLIPTKRPRNPLIQANIKGKNKIQNKDIYINF